MADQYYPDVLNTGGNVYEGYKTDVLDTFLQDSLKVARKTVLARQNNGLPTVGEDTDYRSTSDAERARQHRYEMTKDVEHGEGRDRRKRGVRPRGTGDDGSDAGSGAGSNARYWRAAGSDVASDYPTTAVTSRVPSTVIRETMARVERLEAHLREEKLKREQTEAQLNKLRSAHQA
eukprot:CAMPEP_0197851490 /NCGR_PEP_ID=MMETSP1438-20131217/18223_1 /TAXON_ID=1461541 /ORGANISM="Pterosperma sp., Strain CCMP1384" /LENGTH=175 /DNA_ID=CAMNT_0043465107 /DNA_START=124 /DNA_END=647 /DNA_ORIENTATION=+